MAHFSRLADQEYKLQREMEQPIAFAASTDPDIMYLHEALKQPDRAQFIQAIEKEVNDHVQRKHWRLVRKDDVPKGTKILDAVWAMRRKRRIGTREVYKWKARLNIHGGQQEKGINYWETYAPVVMWSLL